MEKKCKQCKRKFKKPYQYSLKQWELSLYCSRACMGMAWRGKKFSDEARKNMSLAHKRVPDEILAIRKRVRRMVRGALRDGILVKPLDCEQANISSACFGKLEAHHQDYAKPLDVTWLCRRHHLHLHPQPKSFGLIY